MSSRLLACVAFVLFAGVSMAAQAGDHGHGRGHGGHHWGGGHHGRHNDHVRINLGVPYIGGSHCEEPAYYYPAPGYYAPPPRPVYYVPPQPAYYYPAPGGLSFTWYSR